MKEPAQLMGIFPAYHWEAQLEVQPLLVVPGTGPLLVLLGCRSGAAVL